MLRSHYYSSNFWLAGAVTSYYAVTFDSGVSWSQASTTHVEHPVYPRAEDPPVLSTSTD